MTDIQTPPDSKPCVVCREPIRRSARKCIHCDSYQDWLRARLPVSTSVLSLLVALVTVSTAAVPVIEDAIKPRNSNLSFSFQGADDYSLAVIASNQGVRPGTVGQSAGLSMSGRLHVPLNRYISQQEETRIGSGVAVIIEPGTSLLINFSGYRPEGKEDDAYSGPCLLRIKRTDFVGKFIEHKIDVDCNQVAPFVRKELELWRR